ncbi:MAG: hypothetical protein K2I30_02775 [Clostridia bacterium]|nr:hypothetical protein [Clostridia bacterium]
MKNICHKKILIGALLALLIGVALTLALRSRANADCAYAVSYADGTSLTYEISDASELYELADNVNNGLYDGYYGTTFVLNNNVDLNGAEWTPIGNSLYPFKGTFDGGGNAVEGLLIDAGGGEYAGLFGVIGVNGRVENLSVYGDVKGKNYIGGIAGYNHGQINNCISFVNVEAENDALHIGGAVGYNDGEIAACGNSGSVITGFATFAGGVAGSNYGSITNSFNTSSIISSGSVIGGIAGMNSDNSEITVCINSGDISAKTVCGGICGNNRGTVKNTFNSGTVNSDNGTAAGIVGSNENAGTAMHIFNVAEIYGREDIAALCGYNLGLVTHGVYDNRVFTGSAANGVDAEFSKGLPTYLLMHGDALTVESKLGMLSDGNDGIWVKREYSDSQSYYPELKFFYDNAATVSRNAAKASRTCLENGEITLSVNSLIYNGQDRKVDLFFGDIKLEEEQDYKAEYSDNRNAGTAKIDIEFVNAFSGVILKTFEIEKSELAVCWQTLDFTYNAEEQFPLLEIQSGLIDGEEVKFDYLHKESVIAGIYEIEAVLDNDTETNNNYFLTKTTAEYVINASEITVEWSDERFIYNGEIQLPAATVATGKIGSENITFRYEYASNINAGEHSVSVYLDSTPVNSNYCFKGDTHCYVIHKQPISVTWSEEILYYNGLAQFPVAVLSEGRIGEDEITFSYSEFENNIAANESEGYFVLVSLKDTQVNSNYLFEPQRYNYNILKNPIEIEWLDMPLVYNGAAQYPGFYIKSGRIGEEEIRFDISDYSQNIAASNGERYSIELSLAENAVNDNYSFAVLTKTYDILKAEFNPQNLVDFRSQTFAYDGLEKSILINGELPSGVTVTYNNNGQTEIGEYIITATFAVNEDNYKPLTIDTLTVTMCVAQTVFNDTANEIIVRHLGSAVYGLELEINTISKRAIKESGKKTLAAYSVNLTDDLIEIEIHLSGKTAKSKGLKVLYKNTDGEIIAAPHEIRDGKLIFTAENISEFAIVADRNYLPLWICLGIIPVAAAAAVAIIFIVRKRRSNMACAADTCLEQTALSGSEPLVAHKVEAVKAVEKEYEVIDPICGVPFVLDGVHCKSYEWFLKSLNFKNVKKQKLICEGDEEAAKLFESTPHNAAYWYGKRYNKNSKKYAELILKARQATHENK